MAYDRTTANLTGRASIRAPGGEPGGLCGGLGEYLVGGEVDAGGDCLKTGGYGAHPLLLAHRAVRSVPRGRLSQGAVCRGRVIDGFSERLKVKVQGDFARVLVREHTWDGALFMVHAELLRAVP